VVKTVDRSQPGRCGMPSLRWVGSELRKGLGPHPPHRLPIRVVPGGFSRPDLAAPTESTLLVPAEHLGARGPQAVTCRRLLHVGLAAEWVELADPPWQEVYPDANVLEHLSSQGRRSIGWRPMPRAARPRPGDDDRSCHTSMTTKRQARGPLCVLQSRPPTTSSAAGGERQGPSSLGTMLSRTTQKTRHSGR